MKNRYNKKASVERMKEEKKAKNVPSFKLFFLPCFEKKKNKRKKKICEYDK